MSMKTYISSFLAVLTALSFSSCSREQTPGDPTFGSHVRLAVSAAIKGSAAAQSRAERTDEQDQWSYVSFTPGDQTGFYSQHGDAEVDNGRGALTNIPMTYESYGYEDGKGNQQHVGIFTSDKMVSPSLMSGKTSYVYFPYDADAADAAKGLELRRYDERDNIWKCVDFLTMDSVDADGLATDGMMYGEFYHFFSEIIIMRGPGFDAPPSEEMKKITVVMKQPYSHLVVRPSERASVWTCVPELVAHDDYTCEGNSDCKVWEAWHGGIYAETGSNEGRDAWYVILPTVGEGNGRTTVDYIELYDNEGQLQRVSALRFDNGTKRLKSGWRYPLEISMQELVPTVNPFPIVPWEGDTDITDARDCGIYSHADFDNWCEAYAQYLADKTNREKIEPLYQYGNQEVDDKNQFVCWHFYLRTDIDMNELKANTGESVIPKLEDVFDGLSYTLNNSVFQNHTVRNLTKPFVGTLSGTHAAVQHLTLDSPDFHAPARTAAVGLLVGTVGGGTVDQCNVINGNIITNGPVGMVAGTLTSGTVKNCILSGQLFGTATAEKIVGTKTGGTLTDNNAASVIFNQQ